MSAITQYEVKGVLRHGSVKRMMGVFDMATTGEVLLHLAPLGSHGGKCAQERHTMGGMGEDSPDSGGGSGSGGGGW